MTAALGRLSEAPLFIEDAPALSIMQIRAKARRMKAEKGLDLLIVDYLQLVSGQGRFENRIQEVSYISRGLKSIAKELKVPVLALSQLSRAPEQRLDERGQRARGDSCRTFGYTPTALRLCAPKRGARSRHRASWTRPPAHLRV